jgi:hypothetical protein
MLYPPELRGQASGILVDPVALRKVRLAPRLHRRIVMR